MLYSIIVSAIGLPLIVIAFSSIDMLDRSTCIAKDGGKEFYNGPAYNINCKSMGTATQCTIGKGGLLHFLPSAHKISNTIEIECK